MKKQILLIGASAAGCALIAGLVILLNRQSDSSVPEFVLPEYSQSADEIYDDTTAATLHSASGTEPPEAPAKSDDSSAASTEPAATSTSSELPKTTTATSDVPEYSSSVPDAPVLPSAATVAATEQPAASVKDPTSEPKEQHTAAVTAEPGNPVEPDEPEPKPEPEITENVLLTSGDPLHHIRFEFGADRIDFSGVYTDLTVSEVQILREHISSYDLASGTHFSGSLNVSGLTPGYYIIRVSLSDGGIMDYVFEMNSTGASPLSWEELPADENLNAAASPLELPASGVMQHVTSSGDAETAKRVLTQIKELSDEICAGLSDDYSKARVLAQWVSRNMYYDHDASENGVTDDILTLEHVLGYHRSVCFGWSNLYSALCQAQGIWCANASGSVVTGSRCFMQTTTGDERSHSWNMVVIDGRQIWVDTVWNSSNSYEGRRYVEGTQDMQYFDISTAALSQDHRVKRFEHRDYFALA